MKDNNYITIMGWMTKLPLKTPDLFIYACIYGFSQDGKSKYTGSQAYLAKWAGCSKSSVNGHLKGLTARGYLIKEEVYEGNVRRCYYTAVEPENIQELNLDDEEDDQEEMPEKNDITEDSDSLPEAVKSRPVKSRPVAVKSRPNNNIYNNNIYNNNIYNTHTGPTRDDISAYCEEEMLFFVNQDRFLNHYNGFGWEKVRDWKSVIKIWDADDAEKLRQRNPEEYMMISEQLADERRRRFREAYERTLACNQ